MPFVIKCLLLILSCGVLAIASADNLHSYKELTSALYEGRLVSWSVNIPACSLLMGSADIIDKYQKLAVSGTLDTWERFFDSKFGPLDYLSSSESQLEFADSEDSAVTPFYRINTIRIYENNSATLQVETVDPQPSGWVQSGTAKWLCDFTSVASSASLVDMSGKTEEIGGADDLKVALQGGSQVRYLAEYSKCIFDGEGLGMNASAGANLWSSSDRVSSSGDNANTIFDWSRKSMFKNYQGPGYVYDVVKGSLDSAAGLAHFTASDMETTSYKAYYIETFDCASPWANRPADMPIGLHVFADRK